MLAATKNLFTGKANTGNSAAVDVAGFQTAYFCVTPNGYLKTTFVFQGSFDNKTWFNVSCREALTKLDRGSLPIVINDNTPQQAAVQVFEVPVVAPFLRMSITVMTAGSVTVDYFGQEYDVIPSNEGSPILVLDYPATFLGPSTVNLPVVQGMKNMALFLAITAINASTVTLTFKSKMRGGNDQTYHNLLVSAALAANGTKEFFLGPSITSVANLAANCLLGDDVAVDIVVAGGVSATVAALMFGWN